MIRSDEFMTSQPNRASDLRRARSISTTSGTVASCRTTTRPASTQGDGGPGLVVGVDAKRQHHEGCGQHEEIQFGCDPAAHPAHQA